ncbi:MAG: sensor histidine kinase, partial [Vicinamibacteria bacterium]
EYTPDHGNDEVRVNGQDAKYLEIAVQDNGMGIAPEDREGIFNRFRRGRSSGISAIESSGLGLAIAKSLVELQGGRIWVESEPGRGSVFTFTLPRSEGKKESASG